MHHFLNLQRFSRFLQCMNYGVKRLLIFAERLLAFTQQLATAYVVGRIKNNK